MMFQGPVKSYSSTKMMDMSNLMTEYNDAKEARKKAGATEFSLSDMPEVYMGDGGAEEMQLKMHVSEEIM